MNTAVRLLYKRENMEKWGRRFISWAQRKIAAHGYTCDGCGVELFDYPTYRLCENCTSKLRRIGDKVCAKCGRKTVAEGICLDCKQDMPKFTQGLSPFVYQGESAEFVNRLKNGDPRLANYLGEQMAEHFVKKFPDMTRVGDPLLIVPVPMTDKGRRLRGYNQTEYLAKMFAERLHSLGVQAVVDKKLLQKTKETAAQKKMSQKERKENVAGAYHVHKRKECRGKTILLIDDVLTTGATGNECAERLFGAGAHEVYFLVAAAVPERK